MYIKINEYFENSFNLSSKTNVESLEAGAKEFGGATEIDGIIFSNYNNTDIFEINDVDNILGIIIPGTIDINKKIDNTNFVDMIINNLKLNNIVDIKNKDIKGSWITEDNKCIIEDNNLITFKSNNINRELKLLKKLAAIIKKDMNQEAVSIMVNNGLIIY